MKDADSEGFEAANTAPVAGPGAERRGWRLCDAWLLVLFLPVYAEFFALFLTNRKLRFQYGVFLLKQKHLLFQKSKVVAQDGSRAVFRDPLFDGVEWLHIFQETFCARARKQSRQRTQVNQ